MANDVRREFRALMKVQGTSNCHNIVRLVAVVTDNPESVSMLMELAPRAACAGCSTIARARSSAS